MKVTKYNNPVNGDEYREIRETSWEALEELQRAYKAKGMKTWLLPLDFDDPRSDKKVLTILLKKVA